MSRFLVFISVFTLILGSGYSYTGVRLVQGLGITGLNLALFWILIVSLVLIIPVSYFFSQTVNKEKYQSILSYIAFTSLGFFTILFSLVLLKDITTLGIYVLNPVVGLISPDFSFTETFSFLPKWSYTNYAFALGTIGAAGTLTGVGFFQAHRRLKTIHVEIPVSGLHQDLDGFTIVQISDIHIGPTIKGKFLTHVVERVNRLNPDFVAITGDLVDGSVASLKGHILPLKDLRSTYGSYFITGNHEYYSGVLSWIGEVEKLGIHVLLNENRLIKHKSATLTIAGVTDLKAGSILPEHKTDPKKAIIGGENSDFKVLLAHQPDSIKEASQYGYDLQLSGHTHGGQYFPGNIVIYLAQKFVAGLHRYKEMWLYVSRGTGYWGPPLRLGAPSEITKLTLRKA
ncbi:metallophosphoesterase [Leptospira ilyithenensis]|uniref:Metallophosphoesterase n=1 Tax=Leptospira ilyithenensis TaxID=2484901 RepID=A0A4V3JXF3_9LEPT|nr:metallophosphoesterase [Leptospira ilyithenensis]TGN14599.1 metallophosphoesterase [Leptospira ilyithenensis]